MFVLPFILSAALAPFVLGQDDTPLQIQAIEAHFNNSGIVPTLLSTFAPTAVFTLAFQGSGNIQPGQAFTDNSKVAPTPNLTLTGGTYNAGDLFTLAMVDAGPVGSAEDSQTRHWLVNGVTVTGDKAPFTVSTDNATAITEYAGPAPPPGSGPHRYVVLLYSQPSDFQAPDGLNTANVGVSTFDFPSYVQSTHLGALVAGTYFTVEAGTASVSLSATQPVVTSTLPAASSTSGSSSPSSPSTTPTQGGNGSSGNSGSNQGSSAPVTRAISWTAVMAGIAAIVIFN
ncbi:hypothetical protein EIP91_011399 [Steccherinum ochraceum]|uniref:PEBP-like protein n=1 Tax=Steccherinum ochraceum TaxID=92696 RepID=A0A4R0QZR0_9APHY|nr:hypothetical protein EIP91_011399 [Steccherinum ochraceum]